MKNIFNRSIKLLLIVLIPSLFSCATPQYTVETADEVISGPNDPKFYVKEGIAYFQNRQYDRAIKYFNKAIQINPRYAEAYYNRANVYYYYKRQYDQAISDYTKALEIDPRHFHAYNNRGRAYDKKGEYDQAICDYYKALEINPKSHMPYNNLGFAYYGKGQYDEAISHYNKALEIEPKDVFAYNNRALAYESKREYGNAITDYTRVIEIDPNQAGWSYYRRGYSYYIQKEHNKSWEDIKKAQALGCPIPPEFLNELRKASGRQY